MKSVGVLLSGAGVAQLISLLVLPLLVRIYSPQDFDVMAVFVAITIIAYRGAALGFDYALPMADADADAANLLALALAGVAAVAIVVGVLTAIALSPALNLGGSERYGSFRLLVPLSTAMIGATIAFEFWATRQKRFRLISIARLAQALLGSAIQIALGMGGVRPEGLLIGYLVLTSASLFALALDAGVRDRAVLRKISLAGMRDTARRFGEFPRYTAAEGVANALGVYLPVVIVSAALIGPEAGFLLLALRLTQGPLVMISAAVSQIYQSEAREARGADRLGEQTAETLRGLIGLTLGPLLAAAIVAPNLAAMVLGPAYTSVGVYAQWTLPASFLHLLSASIITSMYALRHNAALLRLTIAGLFLRVMIVGALAMLAAPYVVHGYALAGFIFYLGSLIIFMRLNRIGVRDILPRGRLAAVNLILPPLAAAAVVLALAATR